MTRKPLEVRPPEPRNDGEWGICPGCSKEKRAPLGVLSEHRAYHPNLGQMIPCLGSHRPAVTITT